MTAAQVRTWLEGRRPTPPAALAGQLDAVVAAVAPERLAAAPSMAAALSVLGVAALASLEGREARSRGVAMDLLAADAFVTYAFEAAAEDGAPAERVAAGVLSQVAP